MRPLIAFGSVGVLILAVVAASCTVPRPDDGATSEVMVAAANAPLGAYARTLLGRVSDAPVELGGYPFAGIRTELEGTLPELDRKEAEFGTLAAWARLEGTPDAFDVAAHEALFAYMSDDLQDGAGLVQEEVNPRQTSLAIPATPPYPNGIRRVSEADVEEAKCMALRQRKSEASECAARSSEANIAAICLSTVATLDGALTVRQCPSR